MPPRLEIALAVPAEHAAILTLHRDAGWPGTHVEGEVWTARADGDVVAGAQLIELAPGLILLDALVVRSDMRGLGIGTAILHSVLATRAAEWWLECRAERVAFYERLGFELREAPPAAVAARVGANATREQHYLGRSTLSP